MHYYNEFDPKAAAWLAQLMADGLIPHGHIDTRSVHSVDPSDLTGYTQCHFFAGIGGWSYAIRLVGLAHTPGVWTGSCPCQPFSSAGRQRGTADSRHLWPEFARLIAACRPPVVLGEQVASRLGREWLAGVRSDLEAMGYAVGAADLCAAGVGAPHIRQRLYWGASLLGVADAKLPLRRESSAPGGDNLRGTPIGCESTTRLGKHSSPGRLAATDLSECDRRTRGGEQPLCDESPLLSGVEHPTSDGREQRGTEPGRGFASCECRDSGLGHSNESGSQGRDQRGHRANQWSPWTPSVACPCADGVTRRIEPGLEPLAHGVPARVVRLRGYGNAVVPQVAARFAEAFFACTCV